MLVLKGLRAMIWINYNDKPWCHSPGRVEVVLGVADGAPHVVADGVVGDGGHHLGELRGAGRHTAGTNNRTLSVVRHGGGLRPARQQCIGCRIGSGVHGWVLGGWVH